VGENAHWLREHGPIGARDLWTLDILRTNHIAAWFSGCLTLTLRRPPNLGRKDTVVINDVSDEVAAFVARSVTAPIVRTTHLETSVMSFRARFALAEGLIRQYAQARCVVTSRLHCALPCLALGTPVLLIPPPGSANRCAGLLDLVRNCSTSEFLRGAADFDLAEPPENPSRFEPLRDRLIQQCSAYMAASIA
jgi:Polysaccharide pyruvyl transferase